MNKYIADCSCQNLAVRVPGNYRSARDIFVDTNYRLCHNYLSLAAEIVKNRRNLTINRNPVTILVLTLKLEIEMKVYIVILNDKVEAVFATRETAEIFKKAYGGWNIWKIIEKDVL